MNINTKLKHTAISLVIALILAVSAAPVLPAYAAVGTSVNEEVVNQARSVASIIQTRIQLYWSDWVDKQIPYTQDPLTNPAPTWATDAEIAGLVGGATPDGMTFTVEGMPVARDGSFYLVATVDSSMGGAAAASYVRNFLPMAIAADNVVKVPVLRPSFALGLSDIANNPNKVNRDGTTDDGEPTFTDGANITFGDNGSITFDPVTGGNINNVNNLDARNITVSDTLTTNTANITGNAAIDGDLTVGGNITGNLTGNTTGTHTGAVIGNVTGNVTGNLTGDVTGNSSTATRLATARTIALNTGATGTATAFSGAANISIPVTALNAGYLNAGTVPVGRLTGDYGINITGKATTAGLADTAKYANGAGLLKDTDGEAAGAFTIKPLSGGYIEFGGASAPTVVKFGATGTVQPTEYQFGLNGDAVLRGIATSATKLAAAKSIALGTAATGTATAFDGTGSITIPVTALNAGYLSAGTIPTARLSGTYAIGISGKAATAGAADTAANATHASTATSATSAVTAATATNATTAAKAAQLYSVDNRSVATAPNDYVNSLSFGGLKNNAVIGAPSVDVYSYLLGLKGWADSSGGKAHELAFNNSGIFARKGSTTDWEAWEKLVTSANIGGYNAGSATKLAVARTIALGTGATGTATAFDGSVNITIPVTALNAGYLSAGTIPTARLSGSYVIDISGTARYAQELSSPISSVAYATNSGTVGGIAADSFVRSDTADLVAGNHEFYSGSNVYYDAPIEIREVGLVCSGQSSDAYAPALAFHWGNRVATRILLAADGQLKIETNPIIHSGNIGSYAAGNVTTPSGTYKHLGAWGVGRTAAGAILVNTAYTADVATYASSAGSASEIPVSISAPEPPVGSSGTKMLIFPNSKLKIAYGTIQVSRQSYGTHTFPVPFTYAVRAINCSPSILDATYIRSPRCSGDTYCDWTYMVIGY